MIFNDLRSTGSCICLDNPLSPIYSIGSIVIVNFCHLPLYDSNECHLHCDQHAQSGTSRRPFISWVRDFGVCFLSKFYMYFAYYVLSIISHHYRYVFNAQYVSPNPFIYHGYIIKVIVLFDCFSLAHGIDFRVEWRKHKVPYASSAAYVSK